MSEKITTHQPKRNPIVSYFASAFEEFGKVTWPTKEQAALLTGVIIAISLLTAVLIGVFDLGLAELYKLALDKFSSIQTQ
ncbi:MAG: preprotein translocase subunit SecE [Candidatus Gracilibacteria bacterium]